MDDPQKAPLTWEEKAALGCLVLLSLQSLHEFVFKGDGLGMANMSPGSLFLMLFAFLVTVAVLQRRISAWWWGAALLGTIGILLLVVYWRPIRVGLGLDDPAPSTAHLPSYNWIRRPSLQGFGLFWAIARISLYFAAAALLLLGRYRERLRSR